MEVIRTVPGIRKYLRDKRSQGCSIGLVPTMGAIHEGHLFLVRAARNDCEVVVVSIFVNPLQFNYGEDYETYPRDESSDLTFLRRESVDCVFIPSVEEMYPEEMLTSVSVRKLSDSMCGAFRPGHFDGVATVVAKLFNIVQPDKAYFGKKDYQQLKIIQKMVRDLDFPVKVVSIETIREPDGLAMSSRNSYLTARERQLAVELYRTLSGVERLYKSGERNGVELISYAQRSLERFSDSIKVEYIELRDATTLDIVDSIDSPAILALAVRIGKARLIDHVELT